ncbi:GNAT family N-acetyltransferase [Bacillus infantis]|uniref:GNAT family N-acetyltransferase n=1 Tax=Bacillus infantis TaxID=324767 RepID=A0A5D4R3W7_9BACI|nr:GNAT family protein [Bacillus infantis]TYS45439.1 GNAT family N-acetyltransferase [Bacillus infantis]
MITEKLLEGENIRLGYFAEKDLENILEWHTGELFMRHLDAVPVKLRTKDDLKKQWLEENSDAFRFAVIHKDTEKVIGFAEVDGVLWTHKTAWVSLGIGSEEHWGKGYGSEALLCLIDYSFNELNLHRLQLTVFSYNSRAIRLYEKIGFKKEGAYREFMERNGQRYDMFLYGLLRREWQKSPE